MKTQHKIAIVGGIAGFIAAGFIYSQFHLNRKSRKELIEIARELAYTWKKELDLNFEQTEKLEDLIIEYTLKKNEIINATALHEDDIIFKLKSIQQAEHTKLQKIMTGKQFQKYLELNKKISQRS
ncbi:MULTISPECIES: hypothetical protein [Salegentibacter]|uniref:Uncharacterized protein n=1 Tax=Salegentibacter maritimus TaxID=2794347 RepID=A0ABS0TE24_9FLAO|nr:MULTISPECIES: hypothetical protein [Salegentibacter]MBE7639038.1 hypothetical protein [Salegentibacter sp. BLCTC]MBI6115381.1 hypothetical protein [Salegentibacter maritimus]MBI6119065.1 hypothetical protein [Salegentibacter maritimus]